MSVDTFTVATWNAGGGENPGPSDSEAASLLTKIIESGTSVFMGQEFQERHDRLILREMGMKIHRYGPECIIAWQPDLWTSLAVENVVLNPNTPFFRPNSSNPVYCHSPAVILGNKAGLTLDALSLHLPSSVQQANRPERRIAATREAMNVLADRAENSRTHGVDYAGDDNVDEFEGNGPWGFMLQKATGLRLLQAPSNTLGKRKVDDHRVKGLVPVGKGSVLNGPTHHNAHLRKLRFKD